MLIHAKMFKCNLKNSNQHIMKIWDPNQQTAFSYKNIESIQKLIIHKKNNPDEISYLNPSNLSYYDLVETFEFDKYTDLKPYIIKHFAEDLI